MPLIAVAGPSDVVTSAAVSVGEEGGSVVDVAIVAALTAMCTEPGVCGPGGGGFLTIDVPGHSPVVIDGYMSLPGKGYDGEPYLREVTMTYGGGVTTLVDAGSIAVPGVFAGLATASERFGRVPWKVLMDAVADAVESGFPLSAACHTYLNEGAAPIYLSDPVARDALFDGESSKHLGANIAFGGLADTLRHIGEAGADDFYKGDLARLMVDDLSERGAQLTLEDLATYRAAIRKPLKATVGEWDLDLNPAPAVGGVTVAAALRSLTGHRDEDVARALVAAFEERRSAALSSPSTVSIAASDDEGGAVAGSFSAGYGSGVIPKGTGMLMNNAIGELELISDGMPGDRMISNMAPTVARHGGEAVAVGSPGADRITSAVATTLIRLAAGDSLVDSISHPRSHPEFVDDGVRLAAEPGVDLGDLSMPVRRFEVPHMYFGGVNGAGFVGGALQAFADARRTGSVAFATP